MSTPKLPYPKPMPRRANWDKRRRVRVQIGPLGDPNSVTITWEGNSIEVDAVANQMIAAVNGDPWPPK